MSPFERRAVQRLVDQADEQGVPVPPPITAMFSAADPDGGVVAYLAQLGDDEPPVEAYGCCIGSAVRGPQGCTCWEPVYEVEQATPRPPAHPDDIGVAPAMCGDCAFRHGSPEKRDPYLAETLQDLTVTGTPFWCHQGMRRPDRWEHPLLGVVPGSPDDWQPPTVGAVPYRADGSPGLLCAGWAHAGRRAQARDGPPP